MVVSSFAYYKGDEAAVFADITNGKMTLAEFAGFCVNYYGLHNITPAENPFSDLFAENAHYSDILRLAALGVLKGCGDGTVRPSETVDSVRVYTIISRIISLPSSGTTLPPYVTDAMTQAFFWTGKVKEPNKLIMNSEEIATFNKANLENKNTNMSDLESYPEYFDGNKLKKALAGFETPSAHYIDDVLMEEGYYQKIRDNILKARTSSVMELRYGFAVRQSVIKGYPYEGNLSSALNKPEEDDFASSGVMINDPLAVYFATADGKFIYVHSFDVSGWISSEDVAICRDKEEFLSHKNAKNFITVTGEKVYLEPSSDPDLNEIMLFMGATLPLCGEGSEKIAWRTNWNNYTVLLPARDKSGFFYEKKAMLPANRDVTVGFLPLTTANILNQAFKMLGNRYSWGGAMNGVDCSAFVQTVYRTFGITLPRNTTWQSAVITEKSIDWTDATEDKKKADLDVIAPGSVLFFKGHEIMYIGKHDGKYYVINDVGQLVDPYNKDAGTVKIYGTIVNTLDVLRANGHTWVQDLNHALVLG